MRVEVVEVVYLLGGQVVLVAAVMEVLVLVVLVQQAQSTLVVAEVEVAGMAQPLVMVLAAQVHRA